MEIIENNYKNNQNVPNKLKPITTYCSNCGSKLGITKEDTHTGYLGARYVTCPCCGEESMVDEMEGITLTVDNLNFPVHFQRTNKDLRHVVEVYNDEIVGSIKRGIYELRSDHESHFWYTSRGDLFLIVFRYEDDDEYYVVVTKDFYDTYIPFADEDKTENTNV